MDALLSRLFLDPETGYSSIRNLYNRAHKLDPRIKIHDVKTWLATQPAYTVHRYARRVYPRNRVVVSSIDEQWQMDLVDLSSLSPYNNGYKFLLNCIDLFSKFAWSVALKNKSAKSIIDAFNIILKSDRKPHKIQTDAGTEFINKHFQALLKKLEIVFFTTKSELKASVVERFNRTLKERMWRYFTQNNTYKYTDVLDKLLHAYNSSVHRTIGIAPISVNKLNETEILQKVFRLSQNNACVYKFNIGDKVRISKVKGVFEKGYVPNWSEEIFVISERKSRQPPVYTVNDQLGESVEGVFYEYELQKIDVIADVYIVEKVIKTRKRGGRSEYFVKWRGYPNKFNSWVTDLIKL